MSSSKSLKQRMADEKGAELVEFAFLLPLLLVIVAGTWDFGRAYRVNQAITNAAREGARLAVVPAGLNQTAAVQNRVLDYLAKSNVDTSTIAANKNRYIKVQNPSNDPLNTTVTVNLSGGGTTRVTVSRVTVDYPFSFILFGPVMKLLVPGSTTSGAMLLHTTVTMENQPPV